MTDHEWEIKLRAEIQIGRCVSFFLPPLLKWQSSKVILRICPSPAVSRVTSSTIEAVQVAMKTEDDLENNMILSYICTWRWRRECVYVTGVRWGCYITKTLIASLQPVAVCVNNAQKWSSVWRWAPASSSEEICDLRPFIRKEQAFKLDSRWIIHTLCGGFGAQDDAGFYMRLISRREGCFPTAERRRRCEAWLWQRGTETETERILGMAVWTCHMRTGNALLHSHTHTRRFNNSKQTEAHAKQ